MKPLTFLRWAAIVLALPLLAGCNDARASRSSGIAPSNRVQRKPHQWPWPQAKIFRKFPEYDCMVFVREHPDSGEAGTVCIRLEADAFEQVNTGDIVALDANSQVLRVVTPAVKKQPQAWRIVPAPGPVDEDGL